MWDHLRTTDRVKTVASPKEPNREIQTAEKVPLSIRLFPEQISAAKKIAAAKSVGYQTQLRIWIAEGIRRELGRIE